MNTNPQNIRLVVLPGQEDFYNNLMQRVNQGEFTGLFELIMLNWDQVASPLVIHFPTTSRHNEVTNNQLFWHNIKQIWLMLTSQGRNTEQVGFAKEIKRVAEKSADQSWLLEWGLILAISLRNVGDLRSAELEIKNASQLLVRLLEATVPTNDLNWLVASDDTSMIHQLYQWNEKDLCKQFISAVLDKINVSTASHEATIATWNFGISLMKFGEILATRCFEECANLARKNQDYDKLVEALTNQGVTLNDIEGDKQKGLEISLEAIAVARAHGLTNDTHAIFDVGNILLNLGRGAEAEPYLQRAITLGKQRNHHSEVVHAYRALARQFKERGLIPDARELFEEAIAIGLRENELVAANMALAEFGQMLRDIGDYAEALKMHQMAQEVARTTGETAKVVYYSRAIAELERYIREGIVSFMIIKDAKWDSLGMKNIPEINDQAKKTDSLFPYWNLFRTVQLYDEYEKQLSKTKEAIANSISNHDALQEAKNRIDLSRTVYEYLLKGCQALDLNTAFDLVHKNNSEFMKIEHVQDDVVQAGVLFALIIEKRLSQLLHGSNKVGTNDTQSLEGKDKNAFGIANPSGVEGNAQLDEEELLWKAMKLLPGKLENQIHSDFVGIATSLSKPKALQLLKRSQSDPGMRRWSFQLAITLDRICTPEEMLPVFDALVEDTSLEPADRSYVIATIGERQSQMGFLQEANDNLQRALAIAREESAKEVEAYILVNLGMMSRQNGQYENAIHYYDSAISVAQSPNNNDQLSIALHRKGNLLFDLMDFPGARACFHAALDAYLKSNNVSQMALIFDNLANIAEKEGATDKALWYRRQALDLARWSNDTEAIALCSSHLGNTYLEIHEYPKSLELLQSASRLYSELGRFDRVVFIENVLGLWYAAKENPNHSLKQAIVIIEKASDLAERLGVASQQLASLWYLAQLLDVDNSDLADNYLDHVIELSNKIPVYTILVPALRKKAHHLGSRGDWKGALVIIKKALEILEVIKRSYPTRADYLDFVATEYASVCESGACYAFFLADHDLAFQLTEQAKSFSIRDQMEKRWKQRINQDVPEELLQSEGHLLHSIDQINEYGQFATAQHALKRDEEYKNLMTQLDALWQKIEQIDPAYVAMQRGMVLNAQQVRSLLGEREHPSCVVEFLCPQPGNFILMIVVQPNSETGCWAIPITLEMLEQSRQLLIKEITEYPLRGAIGETWHETLSPLSEAINHIIPEGVSILFVPHSGMHHLPLHALPVGGKRLIARNAVSYVPSTAILKFAQKKIDIQVPLVVGAVFEEEAYKIAELLGAKRLIGRDATEFNVREALAEHNMIHFSCHGSFDPKYPLMSCLTLTGNDILTADTILQTRISASLVVLSACQTGQSKIQAGDDLQGLTQAFLLAGTRTVISTLWSIEDQATTGFMVDYYGRLQEKGMNFVKALQQTQVSMIQSGKWSHPFYWAAFVANSIQ